MNAIIKHLQKNETVDESLVKESVGGFTVEQVETDTALTYTKQNNTSYIHWKKFYKKSSMKELLIEVMSKQVGEGSYYFDAQLKQLKSFSSTESRFKFKKSLLEMGEHLLRHIMKAGNVKNSESLEVAYLLLIDKKENTHTVISH